MPFPFPSPPLYTSWLRCEMESTDGLGEPQWSSAWLSKLEQEDSSSDLNG